jgi:hypothetical protein
MNKRTLVLLATVVAAGGLSVPADAAAPCSPAALKAAKKSNKILRGRLLKLRRDYATLSAQLATTLAERDEAQRQLAQAQSGVNGALSTMPAADIWPLFTTISQRYTTPRYSSSYYSSGTDYRSWSFTYCGFC